MPPSLKIPHIGEKLLLRHLRIPILVQLIKQVLNLLAITPLQQRNQLTLL